MLVVTHPLNLLKQEAWKLSIINMIFKRTSWKTVLKRNQQIKIALEKESLLQAEPTDKKKKPESLKILKDKEIFSIEEPGKHKVLELTHSHEHEYLIFMINTYYLRILTKLKLAKIQTDSDFIKNLLFS